MEKGRYLQIKVMLFGSAMNLRLEENKSCINLIPLITPAYNTTSSVALKKSPEARFYRHAVFLKSLELNR